ncbi:MAG: type II toxin-antitoxin system death-on-curing family toxin [Acidobacteria bacterium]|nr:type II toxin-antitoxin system death-on-curing family toxin [Acidobacteriota bacterium]
MPRRRREPAWVERVVLDAVHLDQLREHGGLPGIRDENALESAVARAKQRWHYESKCDLPMLAAAYGWGLATSHPYRDGNKRVAFLVMAIFLELNGWRLEAPESEVVQVMLGVATNRISERQLTAWLRAHVVRIESR